MSKRYVIQILDTVTDENVKTVYDVENAGQGEPMTAWFNLQHPNGGDWMTRSKTTALADAAKLVQAGETRELRIAISKPVYSVTPLEGFDYAAIKNAAEVIAPAAWDTEDEDDEDDDEDEDEDKNDTAPLDVVELENDTWTPGYPSQGN